MTTIAFNTEQIAEIAASAQAHQGEWDAIWNGVQAKLSGVVSEALDEIPPELTARMDNVVIQVAARNDDEPTILGLYDGIALTERLDDYAGVLPDTIWIYREAILDICDDEDDVREEVLITVVHEIAHHFGIDDERLHALGCG